MLFAFLYINLIFKLDSNFPYFRYPPHPPQWPNLFGSLEDLLVRFSFKRNFPLSSNSCIVSFILPLSSSLKRKKIDIFFLLYLNGSQQRELKRYSR